METKESADIRQLANKIIASGIVYSSLFPILRGGYYVAIQLSKWLDIPLTDYPTESTIIVDDLIDSGKTLAPFTNDKAVLYVKNGRTSDVNYYTKEVEGWITFSWEQKNDVENIVERLIQAIGDNTEREGLFDTPNRVVRSWKEIFKGYDIEQKPKVTVFQNGQDGIIYDQMIIDSGEFYSFCEHHMLPFFGKYYFAYVPSPTGKILGLSKVARVVDYFASRLQIQERLTSDIVLYLKDSLDDTALGMALVLKAEHLCKTMRGAKKKGQMSTTYLTGKFHNSEVKDEFMKAILL